MHQLIEIISGAVGDALNEMGDEDPNATMANFTTPRHANQGDVSLPCFSLAKSMKKAPQDIASTLAKKLSPIITKVEEIEADFTAKNYTAAVPVYSSIIFSCTGIYINKFQLIYR